MADWTIFEEDYWAIRDSLQQLVDGANAHSVLLVDQTGQAVTSIGTGPEFDVLSFASLCAADFEANRQLAQLIGETDFTTLYHQGVRESMYLARVDPRVILAVLFDRDTTLGLVRLRVKRATDQLLEILHRLYQKVQQQEAHLPRAVDADYMSSAEAEIDRLFQD